jgi:hypothetical protein
MEYRVVHRLQVKVKKRRPVADIVKMVVLEVVGCLS